MYTVLDNVGIEIEVSSQKLTRQALSKLAPPGWETDRDGSCTELKTIIGNMPVAVESVNESRLFHMEESGGELISPVMNFSYRNKIFKDISSICEKLKISGETLTDCTGIHVHIYMGQLPIVDVLKNLIHLWCAIEAPMYRISTGELGHHRGITHNGYMYCRPLTGKGRQIVLDTNYGYYYAFNLEKMMLAPTSERLIQSFCRADYQPSKWMPARYYAINFMSLWKQGTVEFRLFNSTLEHKYILAWMDLARAICSRSLYGLAKKLDPIPLGSFPESLLFKNFIRIIGVKSFLWPEETIPTLEELWFKSYWQPGVLDQINHLVLKSRKSTPIHEIPESLRPDIVSRDYVEILASKGGNE